MPKFASVIYFRSESLPSPRLAYLLNVSNPDFPHVTRSNISQHLLFFFSCFSFTLPSTLSALLFGSSSITTQLPRYSVTTLATYLYSHQALGAKTRYTLPSANQIQIIQEPPEIHTFGHCTASSLVSKSGDQPTPPFFVFFFLLFFSSFP